MISAILNALDSKPSETEMKALEGALFEAVSADIAAGRAQSNHGEAPIDYDYGLEIQFKVDNIEGFDGLKVPARVEVTLKDGMFHKHGSGPNDMEEVVRYSSLPPSDRTFLLSLYGSGSDENPVLESKVKIEHTWSRVGKMAEEIFGYLYKRYYPK